jgi:arylamine N-acetyltransferase
MMSMAQHNHPVPLPGPGATRLLLTRSGEESGPPGPDHLGRLCRLFARFPYENVTKIIRLGAGDVAAPGFRGPLEVVDGFLQSGAGGTCFSLTNLFLQVLADCGYIAEPFLAHMGRRQNVHCGLIVRTMDGGRALVDPGYLVDRPLALVPGRCEHRTGSARILLEGDGEDYRLCTRTAGAWKERYRFQDRAPGKDVFLSAWLESFSGPGMNQLCLTRGIDGGYIYLHGRHLRRVTGDDKQVRKLGPDDSVAVAEPFGIDPLLVDRAMEVLTSLRRKV